jgi:hypothetical protein
MFWARAAHPRGSSAGEAASGAKAQHLGGTGTADGARLPLCDVIF